MRRPTNHKSIRSSTGRRPWWTSTTVGSRSLPALNGLRCARTTLWYALSISDDLMWRYYLLLTDMTAEKIANLKQQASRGEAHPLTLKKELARRIINDFHGESAAVQAQKDFEVKHERKGFDPNAPRQTFQVPRRDQSPSAHDDPAAANLQTARTRVLQVGSRLDDWLVRLGICKSKGEAQRHIKAGAVSLAIVNSDEPHWQRVNDPT